MEVWFQNRRARWVIKFLIEGNFGNGNIYCTNIQCMGCHYTEGTIINTNSTTNVTFCINTVAF